MINLPELPKKLNKKEANWTTNFLKNWVLVHSNLPSGPIEVKQTTKDYLSFSSVSEAQRRDLLACTTPKGHWWKVADMGRKNDFDVVFYRNSPAWIIIKYPKGFVVIGIVTYIMEMNRSERKSLTWERAVEVSVIHRLSTGSPKAKK